MVKEIAKPERWPWSMTVDGFENLSKKYPGKYAKVEKPVPHQIVIPKKKAVVVKKSAKTKAKNKG